MYLFRVRVEHGTLIDLYAVSAQAAVALVENSGHNPEEVTLLQDCVKSSPVKIKDYAREDSDRVV